MCSQKLANQFYLFAIILSVLFVYGCDAGTQPDKAAKSNERTTLTASEPAGTKTKEGKIMDESKSKQADQEPAPVTDKPKPPTDEDKPQVVFETSKGEIVLELDGKAAPVTVKNFLSYVNDGFYDNTIFHRVIPNFMIQGGGFTPEMVQKKAKKPIINESSNGLKNNRGTICMARSPNPNSATCQFFINHKNNNSLNYPAGGGYTVFGKVVQGMDVVDAIAKVPTTRKIGTNVNGKKQPYGDVPAEPVIVKTIRIKNTP